MKLRIKSAVLVALIGLIASAAIHAASVSEYDVIWDSPSKDCHGSMPIGNGDIGVNIIALQKMLLQTEDFQNDYDFPYLKMEHGTDKAIIAYSGHEDVVLNFNPESQTSRR